MNIGKPKPYIRCIILSGFFSKKMATKEKTLTDNAVQKSILDRSGQKPEADSLIEGPVILVEKSSVFVDLAPWGTGIIYGREFQNAKDIIKKINLGDIIRAKVVETENEDGYIELSLKEAKQALTWSEAEQAIKQKTVIELPVKDANKGGLILEWQGLQGFLPASQLKAEHYPRVLDSEKDNNPDEKKEILSKYNVGDDVLCVVAGIVDFGVFLKLEEGLEGLVHISELDWGLVEDP